MPAQPHTFLTVPIKVSWALSVFIYFCYLAQKLRERSHALILFLIWKHVVVHIACPFITLSKQLIQPELLLLTLPPAAALSRLFIDNNISESQRCYQL